MTDGVLYRFFDSAGRLLYIGATDRFVARLASHQHTKPWFHDIEQISMERYSTRDALMEAEAEAIRNENPLYNLVRYRGVTTLRSFRVSAELWESARAISIEQGETLTSVILAALNEYVESESPDITPP